VESIVMSGGYDDDVDLNDVIYYTGQGSRDSTGALIADQEMKGLNSSLARNVETGEPVRVVRATAKGLRYDGLFAVEDAWLAPGQNGFLICRYRMRSHDPGAGSGVDVQAADEAPPAAAERELSTHFRMVRDGKLPNQVKAMYDYVCQICEIPLETVGGIYAEGAHIIPLGFGHAGVDHMSNILCLCPNHHVLLDHGGISLLDDWTVVDRNGQRLGRLRLHEDHGLNVAFAGVHRQIMGFETPDP
jgi:putative restriction endonuclease